MNAFWVLDESGSTLLGRFRHHVEVLPNNAEVVVDVSHAAHLADFTLVQPIRMIVGRRFRIRGLTYHQERVLAYHGVRSEPAPQGEELRP